MATVPQPLGNFRKSILTELDGIERMFPVLRDAENDDLDAAADLTWKKTIQQVQELEKNFGMRNRLSISIPLTVSLEHGKPKDGLSQPDTIHKNYQPCRRSVSLHSMLFWNCDRFPTRCSKLLWCPKRRAHHGLQEQGTRAESLLCEGQRKLHL